MLKWMDGINGPAMDQFMEALRSGKYKQGRGLLQSADGDMCCLGVAAHLNQEVCGMETSTRPSGRVSYHWDEGKYATSTLLPAPVADHLGIPSDYRDAAMSDMGIYVIADPDNDEEYNLRSSDTNPVSEELGVTMISVVCLNDDIGLSFDEIADRFELTFKVEVED